MRPAYALWEHKKKNKESMMENKYLFIISSKSPPRISGAGSSRSVRI
jgi:hypothetical protein